MKCPSCTARISHEHKISGADDQRVYKCPDCQKMLVRRHGFPFFLIVFAIFVPIVDGILTAVIESLFFSFLGGARVLDIEVIRIVSLLASICLFVVVFVLLDSLKIVDDNADNRVVSENQGKESESE